jgi:transcriptional regulator with XRE-family HTH domain
MGNGRWGRVTKGGQCPPYAGGRVMSDPGGGVQVGRRIVCWRTERAWNQEQLAELAGVSRTTLCRLERGRIARPQPETLGRIAAVFGQPLHELLGTRAPADGPGVNGKRAELPLVSGDGVGVYSGSRWREVDRTTNPAVETVSRTNPELFVGWARSDWDRLYGTFGVGGALSDEGVRAAAGEINRGKETTRKLLVLLETHLGETAATLIDALYQQVVVAPAKSAGAAGCGRKTPRGTSS